MENNIKFIKEHYILDVIDMFDYYTKNGGNNYKELIDALAIPDHMMAEIISVMNKMVEEASKLDAPHIAEYYKTIINNISSNK